MSWTSAVTTAGLALLAGLEGHTLNVTRAVCGSASTTGDLSALTVLTSYKMDLTITELTVDGATASVRVQLGSGDVAAAFSLYQLGLYARLDDDAAVLLAVWQTDTPVAIPASSEVDNLTIDYLLNVTAGNATSVTAEIDTAAMATVGMVNNVAWSTPETVTAPVISLPSTVVESEPVMVLSGNTRTNLVTNGNFASGATGWIGTYSSLSAANNVLSDTAAGTYISGIVAQGCNFVSGRMYYFRVMARVTNTSCSSVQIRTNQVSTIARQLSPVQNTWYLLSGIRTPTTDNAIWLQHSYADAATASGKVMEIKEVMVIDLTALGLEEYTALQLDLMFSYWFDGTKSTGPQRLVSVTRNSFDKDHANFLMGRLLSSNPSYTSSVAEIGAKIHYIRCNQNTTYTIQRILDSTFRVACYDTIPTNDAVYTQLIADDSGTAISITTDAASKYLAFCVIRSGMSNTESDMLDSIQAEPGTAATPYVPYAESTAYVPAVGNSLLNGTADTVGLNTGKKTQNVQTKTLVAEDITVYSSSATSYDTVVITKPTDYIKYNIDVHGNGDVMISGGYQSKNTFSDNAENIYAIGSNSVTGFKVAVPKGTVTDLATAKTYFTNKVMHYQLATPIVTELDGLGSLTAYPSGTIFIEPMFEFTAKPVDGVLTVPNEYADYPIDSVESVRLVEDGTEITPDSYSSTTVTLPTGADTDAYYEVTCSYYTGLSVLPSVCYSYAMNLRAALAATVTQAADTAQELEDLQDVFWAWYYDLETRATAALGQVKTGTGTLAAASWTLSSGIYSQSVADEDITAVMDVDVTIDDASMANAIMGAAKTTAYDGGFTVKCTIRPTADLAITYAARKVGM